MRRDENDVRACLLFTYKFNIEKHTSIKELSQFHFRVRYALHHYMPIDCERIDSKEKKKKIIFIIPSRKKPQPVSKTELHSNDEREGEREKKKINKLCRKIVRFNLTNRKLI